MRKVLFLIAGCVAMLFSSVQLSAGAEIGQKLTSQEVTTLLTHKTFFVQQLLSQASGGEKRKDYHAYFSPDGAIQVNYSARQTKSGKWDVGGKGQLCFNFILRGGASKRGVRRCGTLVKRGPYTFERINDQGEHTATLTLVANGNKFPKK